MAKRDEVYIDIIAETKKSVAGMVSFAAAIAAVVIAVKALEKGLKGVLDITMSAAKQAQIGMAFENMAFQAGFAADSIVADMQRMSGETISELDIMGSASKAALLGIPLERMAELMQVARAAGVAMGRDTSEMFEKLAVGIGRRSRLILDDLGIQISATEATSDYAAALGKTAEEMSDAESKQGFLNAVLKDGVRVMEMVGEAGQNITPLEPMQQFQAAAEDLKVALGDILLPAINVVFTSLARGFRNFITWVETVREAARARKGETEELNAAIVAEIEQLDKLAEAERQLQLERERYSPPGAVEAREDTVRAEMEHLKMLQDQTDRIEEQNELRAEALAAQIEYKEGQLEIANALQTELDFIEKINKAYGMTDEGKIDALEEQLAIWQEILSTVNTEHFFKVFTIIEKIKEELKALTGEEWVIRQPERRDAPTYLENVKREFEGIRPLAREVAEQYGIAEHIIENTFRNAERLGDALADVKEEAVSIVDELLKIQEGIQAFIAPMLAFAAEVERLANAWEPATEAITEWEQFALQAAFDVGAAISTALTEGGESGAEALKNAVKSAAVAALKMWGRVMMFSGNPIGAFLAFAGAGAIPAMGDGGTVYKPTIALIGEKGPERVTPLNNSVGSDAPQIVINVHGSIVTERELEGLAINAVGRLGRGY